MCPSHVDTSQTPGDQKLHEQLAIGCGQAGKGVNRIKTVIAEARCSPVQCISVLAHSAPSQHAPWAVQTAGGHTCCKLVYGRTCSQTYSWQSTANISTRQSSNTSSIQRKQPHAGCLPSLGRQCYGRLASGESTPCLLASHLQYDPDEKFYIPSLCIPICRGEFCPLGALQSSANRIHRRISL